MHRRRDPAGHLREAVAIHVEEGAGAIGIDEFDAVAVEIENQGRGEDRRLLADRSGRPGATQPRAAMANAVEIQVRMS